MAGATNANRASLTSDGSVWLEQAGHGHWMTQHQIDRALRAIDAGV